MSSVSSADARHRTTPILYWMIRKLLRDVRVSLIVVCLILGAFQCLWAKIIERVTAQLLPQLLWLGAGRNVTAEQIEKTIFDGPGKVTRTLMGGESVSLFRTQDMMTVGFVHPVMLTLFCIWAIGRASGAVAGELDRGTMELLLAQPVPRSRLILAHFLVELLTLPLLCLSLFAGIAIGIHVVHLTDVGDQTRLLDPWTFAPALWNVAALVFAVSGITMWLSASGRFRWRVLGTAVFVTLLQFLVNAIGQLWEATAFLRPLTVFYYYQPQQIILKQKWTVDFAVWNDGQPLSDVPVLAVLLGLGAVGYLLAWWTLERRDLPAPL